jgi:uncharacterized protein
MSIVTAKNIIDYVFLNAKADEKIEFGYFGGEPLLEFGLIKDITRIIRAHSRYSAEKVALTITTNGTLLSGSMMDYFKANDIVLCISCDGPPYIQNKHRHFRDGRRSSILVEKNISYALKTFPLIPVNAVYSPDNLEYLPEVVNYLASLGVERIFLNPDISANWTKKEAARLTGVFEKVGKLYLDYYLQAKPKYISLIDSKVSVILRGGYLPMEKCSMGQGELAFAPSGNIYPCERLIGADEGNLHCLGNINTGFDLSRRCHRILTEAVNPECLECGLNSYCMNWCGCTNYAMSGAYNKAAPFLCALEKAAISLAFEIIRSAGESHIDLSHNQIGPQLIAAMPNY